MVVLRNDCYHLRDAIDEMPFYAPVVGSYFSVSYIVRGGIFHTDDNGGWETGAKVIGSSY